MRLVKRRWLTVSADFLELLVHVVHLWTFYKLVQYLQCVFPSKCSKTCRQSCNIQYITISCTITRTIILLVDSLLFRLFFLMFFFLGTYATFEAARVKKAGFVWYLVCTSLLFAKVWYRPYHSSRQCSSLLFQVLLDWRCASQPGPPTWHQIGMDQPKSHWLGFRLTM